MVGTPLKNTACERRWAENELGFSAANSDPQVSNNYEPRCSRFLKALREIFDYQKGRYILLKTRDLYKTVLAALP